MDTVLYSWLAAAAVAPFVTLLSCWTLAVFQNYKSNWRLLDIFLYSLTCLEVVSGLFLFGYAILGAIRPDLEAPCRFLMWGLTATRTFHLSAVTSLMLDRALTFKWPRAYRSSVRHSQIRYHIAVLTVLSIFVGVTSVFARVPSSDQSTCSLHPLQWDLKFTAFLSGLYALLLLTGFGCCLIVQAGRFRSRSSYETSWTRGSADGSAASLDESKNLEWVVVVCICWLSYMVNHGPFLVLSVLGMAVPTFWSEWLDNSVVWLCLVQGLLVPCILLLADLPHRTALKNMLKQPGRMYRHLTDNGGYRIQIGEIAKHGGYPIYPPYHVIPLPQRLRWSPNHFPSLQSLQPVDVDTVQKGGYGSDGYTSLLSFPSSSTSFSTAFSSCSSAGQSVTTNAVDDFVFRRPSVMTIFDQSSEKQKPVVRRCDTPTPFMEGDTSDLHIGTSPNVEPAPNISAFFSEKIQRANPSEETGFKIQNTSISETQFSALSCDLDNGREEPYHIRDVISKNMINIILHYEKDSAEPASARSDVSEMESQLEESFEDRSSSSSESSDADSVQSVIIRQKVDTKGRVSQCDISRVEKKSLKYDKDQNKEDNIISEQRIRYSEYL